MSIPVAGETLSMDDLQMIFDAVKERQDKDPDEPAGLSFFVVLSHIGERFRKVECVEQEFTCLKKDIPTDKDVPTCPNGHTLTFIEDTGLAIGWIPEA